MQKRLARLGAWLVAVFFCLVFVACLPSFLGAGWYLLLVPVLAGLWAAVWLGIRRLNDKTALRIFAISLPVWFALLVLFAFAMRVEPAWDFGRVHNAALEIAAHHRVVLPTTQQYLLQSANNFFITLLLVAVAMAGSLVGLPAYASGILLNCLALALSVLFLFLALRAVLGAHRALLCAVGCYFFAPMVLYAPIYYTDTLSMPFVACTLWCAVRLAHTARRKGRIGWALAMGAAAGVGAVLKPTAAILFIALGIVGLLASFKKVWKPLLLATLVCVGVLLCWRGFEAVNPVLDTSQKDNYRLTALHYVMMGLTGNGGYNEADHFFSASFGTRGEREAANRAVIQQRLADFGPAGLVRHLRGKVAYTWADGSYYAPRKLAIDPVHQPFLHEWLLPQGAYYSVTMGILMAVQALYLGLITAGMLRAAVRRGGVRLDVVFACRLALFGLGVFLLVWETRSRYLVNFAPLLAALALLQLAHCINRVWPLHKEDAETPPLLDESNKDSCAKSSLEVE